MDKHRVLPIIRTNGLTMPSFFELLLFVDLLDCINEEMNLGMKRGGVFDYKVLSTWIDMPITEKTFNDPKGLSVKSTLSILLEASQAIKNKLDGENSSKSTTSNLEVCIDVLNKLAFNIDLSELSRPLEIVIALLSLMLNEGWYKKNTCRRKSENHIKLFDNLINDPSIDVNFGRELFSQVAPMSISIKNDEHREIIEYQSSAAEWEAVVFILKHFKIELPRTLQLLERRITLEKKILSDCINQGALEPGEIISLIEEGTDLKVFNPRLKGNSVVHQSLFNYRLIFDLLTCSYLEYFERLLRESYRKNEGLVEIEMIDTHLSNAKKSLLSLVGKNEKRTFFEYYLRSIYKLNFSEINSTEPFRFEVQWEEDSISKIAKHLPEGKEVDIANKERRLKRYFQPKSHKNSRTISSSDLMGFLKNMVGDESESQCYYFFFLKLAISLDESKQKLSKDSWTRLIAEIEEGVSTIA